MNHIDQHVAEIDRTKLRGVRPFDRDRLMMTARDDAARAGMAMLTPVQDEAPEVIVAGLAVLFAESCRRLGLDAREAHEFGRRVTAPQEFHHKGNITVETFRDFVGLRLKGDANVGVA
jgi:hypothetical protein